MLDSLTTTATQDPEGFLGHPVNAFKLMKRLNTEWGNVESLVLRDMSNGVRERHTHTHTLLQGMGELVGHFHFHFHSEL